MFGELEYLLSQCIKLVWAYVPGQVKLLTVMHHYGYMDLCNWLQSIYNSSVLVMEVENCWLTEGLSVSLLYGRCNRCLCWL